MVTGQNLCSKPCIYALKVSPNCTAQVWVELMLSEQKPAQLRSSCLLKICILSCMESRLELELPLCMTHFLVQKERDEILASWWRYSCGRWNESTHLWLSGSFKLSCKVKHCQQEKPSSALLAPFVPECHLIRSGQSSKGHKVGDQTPLHGQRENISSPASWINSLTAELLGKRAHLLLEHPRKPVLHFLCLSYQCPKRKIFYLGWMEYRCSASSNSSGSQHCKKNWKRNVIWTLSSNFFCLVIGLGGKPLIYTFKR